MGASRPCSALGYRWELRALSVSRTEPMKRKPLRGSVLIRRCSSPAIANRGPSGIQAGRHRSIGDDASVPDGAASDRPC